MIILVARNRCAPALDRVGQKTCGSVVLDAAEGFGYGLDAVAAEVLHQIRHLIVAAVFDQRINLALITQVI